MSVDTYMCTRFHTHAHMLTFRPVLISTHTGIAGVICAQDTEAQRHQYRQIHADPCRLMHVSGTLWSQNRHVSVYLKDTCPNMCSLLRMHTG